MASMYTIPEFCTYARISQALFFKLRSKGAGPAVTRLGVRVLISHDAAAEWLAANTSKPVAAV